MSEQVFVYGTLKRGGACEEILLQSGGHYVCDAEVSGIELYLLPMGFPAAVFDPTGTAIAKGEIWLVHSLLALDQLEGNGHHYQREQVTFSGNQGKFSAWIYLYKREIPEAAMPLVSGKYPVENGEAENLLYEWAHYHGWQTPFGHNGFDEYIKNDSHCYMDCKTCPYSYNEGCEYNDKF